MHKAIIILLSLAVVTARGASEPKALTPAEEFRLGTQLFKTATSGETSGSRGDIQRKASAHISVAAVKGLPDAAEAMSELYEIGLGLPIDTVMATTWAYVARDEGRPSRAAHVESIYNPEILAEGLRQSATFKPNTWDPVKLPEEPKPTPEPEKKPELLLTQDQAIALFKKLKVTGISCTDKGVLCVTIDNTILVQGQSMNIEDGAKTYVFECTVLEKDRVILTIRETPYTHIYQL